MSIASSTKAPSATAKAESRFPAWLRRMFFYQLGGITFKDWCELLRENRFAVDPVFWPKAAVVTGLSLVNSAKRRREARLFSRKLAEVEVRPPLFVLGHWRGGTTHLHNLLALDERFAFPNFYQVANPHTFLLAGPRQYGAFDRYLPATRKFDNVAIGSRMPAEDEFAACTMSLRSPYMRSFPRSYDRYRHYLTFRGVPEADVARWKDAMVLFLKRLTLLYDRPLILKSPPHTCRIKLLLELFPDARFLHIRRNPYSVFRSTLHLERMRVDRPQFQSVRGLDLEQRVLERYIELYDVYFEERSLIPRSRLHELSFEDLERDPIGQMSQVYETIGLERFDDVLPRLESYIAGQANYRKNDFQPMDPALKRRIGEAWQRSFEEWGYARD